jgi:hypothetical protein
VVTIRQRAATVIWLAATALIGSSCGTVKRSVKFNTAYQAVFLDSGAVYFGKLEGLGTDYPVLTSVFYIRSSTDPETKKVSNILIRRGSEWHAPDRMVLNASHIIFVEPVTAESQVATLISQSK